MSGVDSLSIKKYLKALQNQICAALARMDERENFHEDAWEYSQGGGGRSRVLTQGAVFERVGVNFSHVLGKSLPPAASKHRPDLSGCPFEAMGVSLVAHPQNPYVPTSHMNVRYFCAQSKEGKEIWWFGGGYDLTPYYGFVEDCRHWHQVAKACCDRFKPDLYPRLKEWADTYFYIKHRQEPRGIGGLFFDDFNELGEK